MHSTIPLDPNKASDALETAIRTQASIILESPAFPNTTINGFLLSGDDQALLMEITGQPNVDFDTVIGASCQGQIYGDLRYCFSSKITSLPAWGKSRSIAIQRPKRLHVMDRRRFLRARLAPSSELVLQWCQAGTPHRHVVDLLNISADGLACRINDAFSRSLSKKDRVSVSFELPGHEKSFDLRARVTNITQASEGSTILGLQFERCSKDRSAIAALRIAIEGRGTLTPAEELCV